MNESDLNEWPKLEAPAKVGGTTFGKGIPASYVIRAAQRLHAYDEAQAKLTPEQRVEEERRRRGLWDFMNGPLDAAALTAQQRADLESAARYIASDKGDVVLTSTDACRIANTLMDLTAPVALAASQQAEAVHRGWPTHAMIEAGRKAAASHGPLLGNDQSLWHVFRDMYAAAIKEARP